MAPTIILRHRKENLKKCSLTPLSGHSALVFYSYPQGLDQLPIVPGTILLTIGAPVLSPRDGVDSLERGRDQPSEGGKIANGQSPLLLIDGTWRLAKVMQQQVIHRYGPALRHFSLPSCRTAYPRRQTDCAEPEEGLASVEALFLAHAILGRPCEGLLDGYHWKDSFLEMNRHLWEQIAFREGNLLD